MKKLIYFLMGALLMLIAVSCNKDSVLSPLEGTKWRTKVNGLYSSTREFTLTFSDDGNTVTWNNDGAIINGTYAYSNNNKEVLFSGLKDESYTLTKAYKSVKPGCLVVDVAIGTSFTHLVFSPEQ